MNEGLNWALVYLWIILCQLRRRAVNQYMSSDSVRMRSAPSSSLFCWSAERLIERNQKPFISLSCTSLKEATCQKRKANFPSMLVVVFDPGQIRKQKVEDVLWNMKAFRSILPLLERCPLFWKGLSSKPTPVTLSILLPIKIYWKHPGNAVWLISSRLACQKQTNKAIKDKKGILFWPLSS